MPFFLPRSGSMQLARKTRGGLFGLKLFYECSDMILKVVLREALHCDNPTYHWIRMNLQLSCSAARDSLSLCKKYHPFISVSDSGSCSELPYGNSLSDFGRTLSEWVNLIVSTLASCVTLPKKSEFPSTLRVLPRVLLFSAFLSVSFKSSLELRGNLDSSAASKLFVSIFVSGRTARWVCRTVKPQKLSSVLRLFIY